MRKSEITQLADFEDFSVSLTFPPWWILRLVILRLPRWTAALFGVTDETCWSDSGCSLADEHCGIWLDVFLWWVTGVVLHRLFKVFAACFEVSARSGEDSPSRKNSNSPVNAMSRHSAINTPVYSEKFERLQVCSLVPWILPFYVVRDSRQSEKPFEIWDLSVGRGHCCASSGGELIEVLCWRSKMRTHDAQAKSAFMYLLVCSAIALPEGPSRTISQEFENAIQLAAYYVEDAAEGRLDNGLASNFKSGNKLKLNCCRVQTHIAWHVALARQRESWQRDNDQTWQVGSFTYS